MSGIFLFKSPDNIACVGFSVGVMFMQGVITVQTQRRGTNTSKANDCGKHLPHKSRLLSYQIGNKHQDTHKIAFVLKGAQ